ncbi:MAG: hypothetical protein M3Z04_18255 [Chloroflexota bacterium]|nr:hypothetical protein [Chloroflexota bacterium]
MSDQKATPASPEVQPPAVRRDLQQTGVTHQGDPLPTDSATQSDSMGATEEQVTPVQPPVSGPANLVGDSVPAGDPRDSASEDDEPLIDPADMITPG